MWEDGVEGRREVRRGADGSFQWDENDFTPEESMCSKEQRKTQNLDYLVAINLILSRILDTCHDAFIQTNTMHGGVNGRL